MSMTIEMLEKRVEVLEKQLTALVTSNAKDVKTKKKEAKKEKKESSDDEAPKKKRTSGYIIFSNAHRDVVKGSIADGDEKPKNTDVMKELARLWKALTDEERGEWNTKAKELKELAEEQDGIWLGYG